MIISLCGGYGGLDRAVAARFRMPVAAHAEPENSPVLAVLAARFPGVPNLGDIREVDWSPWRGACGVLCAGFPCQPVSAAGRQLAEDDDRWLWPSVHRAIVELAPERIVLENVANIISIQGGRIWRLILAELQAAGYGVAWGIFGACLVGACHPSTPHVPGRAPGRARCSALARSALRRAPWCHPPHPDRTRLHRARRGVG